MVFKVGEEEFGVDVADTVSIILLPAITRVPKAPEYIKGVINLRGEIIPVMDLRERFGRKVENTEETRVLIFNVDEAPIGCIVDSVSEVLQLPQENVKGVSELGDNMVEEYIFGIAKIDSRVISLVDLEKLVA